MSVLLTLEFCKTRNWKAKLKPSEIEIVMNKRSENNFVFFTNICYKYNNPR